MHVQIMGKKCFCYLYFDFATIRGKITQTNISNTRKSSTKQNSTVFLFTVLLLFLPSSGSLGSSGPRVVETLEELDDPLFMETTCTEHAHESVTEIITMTSLSIVTRCFLPPGFTGF